MNRRQAFRPFAGLATWPWLAGASLTLAACSGRDAGHGPVEVVWDRDTCERCGMVLSDRFHAAQIRDADGKPHRFDDLGCALFWSEQHGLSGKEAGFWITDFRSREWVDARAARYVAGRTTPMGYGYGGTLAAVDSHLTLADARAAILARGR
ncbi:MAG: nitrous oxide reductase accessory protein NosL [Rhodocyclaceae bacterium]|nr:nitrous oxide reductase accessory protein NosL [Rhodocyclaceae bacterium]